MRLMVNMVLSTRQENESFLANGIMQKVLKMAWHYSEFDNNLRYEALEEGARYRKVGLWRDEQPVAPWEWRRMSKQERDRIRVKN